MLDLLLGVDATGLPLPMKPGLAVRPRKEVSTFISGDRGVSKPTQDGPYGL